MNPNQNSLTRDPTRVRSHNPKPDPRAEKRTRPIPITWVIEFDLSWPSILLPTQVKIHNLGYDL